MKEFRGGAWFFVGGFARSACRFKTLPGNRYGRYGFRLKLRRL